MADSGNFAAYKQLTPLKGSIADDLQNQQQLQNQKRGLDLEEERLEYSRQQAAEAKKQKLADYVQSKIPKNVDTKVRSVNSFNNTLIQKAVDRIGDIGALLDEDLDKKNLSYEQRAKLKSELNSLQNLPENIKTGTSLLTAKASDYWEGVKSGKYRKNPAYEKFSDIGTNGWYAELDENGNPLIGFDKSQDKDGDGKPDVLSYENIMAGVPDFQFDKIYDKENLVKEAITKIQPVVNSSPEGNFQVKRTGLDLDAVNKHVDDLLFKSDGTPTDVLKSFAFDNNVSLNNKKELQTIKDDFINSMTLYSKQGVEKEYITKPIEFIKEANDEKNKSLDRAEKNKNEPVKELGSKNINQVGIVKGNTPKEGSVLKNMNGAKAYSIEGSNLERAIGEKGAYERVNNIYVLPNKTLALEVDRVDGTVTNDDTGEKSSNTTKVLYRSDKNANEIADFITKKINPKTGKRERIWLISGASTFLSFKGMPLEETKLHQQFLPDLMPKIFIKNTSLNNNTQSNG